MPNPIQTIQTTRQALRALIDQVEDQELLALCTQLLTRELRKEDPVRSDPVRSDPYANDVQAREMRRRADESLQAIEKGEVVSLEEFSKQNKKWLRKNATK